MIGGIVQTLGGGLGNLGCGIAQITAAAGVLAYNVVVLLGDTTVGATWLWV
ncbi:MAG: hypothetical protein LBM23_01995 [Propionibacteriaceae bacterium]|jgi:hypothetical protein|nr:hypothetical protein [Propionibacteriaceae bacterium]